MKLNKPSRLIGRSILLIALVVGVAPLALPSTNIVLDRAVQIQSSQSGDAESELHKGIALSQQGHFQEAIPHFLAARGHVTDEYAANFNLALCYVGTNQFNQAIQILKLLKDGGRSTPAVNDLLSQAYVATAQPEKAFSVFQEAIQQTPLDGKLYLLVAEACMDHASYNLGLTIVNVGLKHLPRSARLHYERGLFLAFENEVSQAAFDYELAAKLAPKTDIAYMALGQDDLLKGDVRAAIDVTRTAIERGNDNYIILTIFGNAVALAGISPNHPVFAEAERALQRSIADRPHYAIPRLALGELYLAQGHIDEAVAQLEAARQLAPSNATVYSRLAIAYRREGRTSEELQMLSVLSKLNQEKAQKYKSDSPNRAGYTATGHLPQGSQ